MITAFPRNAPAGNPRIISNHSESFFLAFLIRFPRRNGKMKAMLAMIQENKIGMTLPDSIVTFEIKDNRYDNVYKR